MQKKYGNPPKIINTFRVSNKEMMFYLYLPVKLKDSTDIKLPERLMSFSPIVKSSLIDFYQIYSESVLISKYVYLTVKTLWVEQGNAGNRPGWHVDGYGSNGDINYIYSDMNPTEFAIQELVDIPDDDILSMVAMTEQIKSDSIVTYPDNCLLRLDESVVHRVNPIVKSGVRTFVKISVSDHKYNLVGNSHNHLLDYDWDMTDRSDIRNLDNKDFVK